MPTATYRFAFLALFPGLCTFFFPPLLPPNPLALLALAENPLKSPLEVASPLFECLFFPPNPYFWLRF